jgi:hypothetical protein
MRVCWGLYLNKPYIFILIRNLYLPVYPLRTPHRQSQKYMNENNFAHLYCVQNNIDPARYEREVLMRSAYPHARFFIWFLLYLKPEFLAADFDFVRAVGDLRRFRDFDHEKQAYAHHPGNTGFFRRTCYIRISSRALRRMVRETLHSTTTVEDKTTDDSGVPFQIVSRRETTDSQPKTG